MSFENRGGIPRVFRDLITTTGRKHMFPSVTKYVQISNEGASAVRVYWRVADFDADVNYIELAAATGWFEGPVEARELWLRAATAPTDVVVQSYARRG